MVVGASTVQIPPLSMESLTVASMACQSLGFSTVMVPVTAKPLSVWLVTLWITV